MLIAGGWGGVPGSGNYGFLTSAELYDPSTKTVSSAGDMAIARQGHTGTLLPNGKVLIVGGASPIPWAPDYWTETTSAELYDPIAGIFTATGSLTYPRAGHAALLLADGRVLVAGGGDGFYTHETAELYDPGTETFTVTGSMSVGRAGSPAALLGDGSVLIAGGYSAFDTWASSERYDPATEQFSPDTALPGTRSRHSLTSLTGGTLLLTGGVSAYAGAGLTSSLTYESGTRLYTPTADLAVARWQAPAVRLTDGRVLVVGGDGDPDHRTAEIYVPSERRYVGTGALRVLRDAHTATLLGDGTVLIAGGNYDDTSLELFGPALPPPTSLQIQPGSASIPTGGSQSFSAVDDLGRTRLDAVWTISDPTVASLQFASGLPTVKGLNPGQVTLTGEIDGVEAQAAIMIVPQSVRITPAVATLLVGHQRQFSVVDERGRPSQLATWTLSDETLAAITSDNSPVLTALGPGQVTLTATVLGVTMTAEVTILGGTSYPQGTVLWTAPVIPGFIPTGIVQTVMFEASNTATYTVQRSSDGAESLVQAFTNDGRQLWERRMRPLIGEPVSDGKGGLLVTEACDSESPVQLSDLDETTGAVKWYTQIAPQYVGTGCPTEAPRIAIRHDGAVAFSAPPNTLPGLLVVSEWGGLVSQPSIPLSTAIDRFGQTISLPATMGAPIVDGDSVIYVQYAVRQIPYPATSVASQLYLLKILPDGTTSTVTLGTSTEASLLPGSLLPDGNGGVLATWELVKVNPPAEPEPYRAAHLSSAGAILSTYTMPYAPTTTTSGAYGLPLTPSLVLGESGTAFAAYGNNVASFDLASGAANWNYDAGSTIMSLGYNAAAGLTLIDAFRNQIGISSSGATESTFSLAAFSMTRPDWEGNWQGAQPSDGIALAAIETTRMDWGTSDWVTQGGSPAAIGAAIGSPFFPWLPQGAPGIGPHEAIYDALDDLVDRLKSDSNLRDKAQQFVLDPVSTRWEHPLPVAAFLNYLDGKGRFRPHFYDGTRSTFCYNVLKGGSDGACKEGYSGTKVMSVFPTGTTTAAVTWTPHNPLYVFFNPALIGVQAAGRNLGNEALVFHEALHGLTGLSDQSLLIALGWPFMQPSCTINVVIQRDVLVFAPGLDAYIAMTCARPPYSYTP